MARVKVTAAAAAMLALGHADNIAKECPFTDICYSLNLPTATFTTNPGSLFFQISGPDTYTWIALGQGSAMEGANIFVIYADGTGNVTLSPRLGTDMEEPQYNPDADVTLLAGSGVSGGRMVANVHCANCGKWDGGSMNLTAPIATWIGAALPGPPLDSPDPKAHIMKHFVHAVFPWDLSSARGGNSTNPFYVPTRAPTSPGGIGTPTAIAHGVLASLAFVAILPSGAIFVRFARFRRLVWVHATIQISGYLVYVAAAGLGIHMLGKYPMKYYRWDMYSDPHPKIGLALLAYMFFQPISGAINHWLFGRKGRRLFSHYIHIWAGRAAILLGIINGGFGLRLGRVEYAGYRAAYGVCATVMGVLFVASIVFAERHRDMPNPSALHRGKTGEQAVSGEGQGHVRMHSMEDGERLRTADGERVE